MLYWKEYKGHNVYNTYKDYDQNIYTLDIETTSLFKLKGKQHNIIDYLKLTEKEKTNCILYSTMYIWQFSINDIVYYGRTWDELQIFLTKININSPYKKIVFIHNLSYEFQFIKSIFNITEVLARTKRKVMRCLIEEFNIELRCSYFLSNTSLDNLSKVYNLNVKKQTGKLDYNLIRHSETELTEEELLYCEYDCIVLYEYIKIELETYKYIQSIPLTSTGHIRRELKKYIQDKPQYKRLVNKAINTDPHIYNFLIDVFTGGYTHANYLYTDEIIENVDSFDFTSSYPYVMCCFRYPSSEFKKCNVKRKKDLSKNFAYLLEVEFNDIHCLTYNTFISKSKCKSIKGGVYDNGRIISADKITIRLTDIDFNFILLSHKISSYEIKEAYYSIYRYLPTDFINFILSKYQDKTTLKGQEGKEIEYTKAKNKFNALYGMCVTNTIRDEVLFDNVNDWQTRELTNKEIQEKLNEEKKKSFLSFAFGVWVTAHARNNLQELILSNDEYNIYSDTDSSKLKQGYNKEIIKTYNNKVLQRIHNTAKVLEIDENLFTATDIKGKSYTLGIFEYEGTYNKFITQGAKKYAYEIDNKINITVSGVPKKASKSLNSLDEFKDDYIFKYEDTNKNLASYIDEQKPTTILDYQGNVKRINDKSGIVLLPVNYTLKKSLEYVTLINENSSKRARFNENEK